MQKEKLKSCEKQDCTTWFTVIKLHNVAKSAYWLVIFGAEKMEKIMQYSFQGFVA